MTDTWTEIELVARRYKLAKAWLAGFLDATERLTRQGNQNHTRERYEQLVAGIAALEKRIDELQASANLAKDYFRRESNLAMLDLQHYLKHPTENEHGIQESAPTGKGNIPSER